MYHKHSCFDKFTFSLHLQTPWTALRTFLATALLRGKRPHHLHDKSFTRNLLLSFVICNQPGQMKRLASCVIESRPKSNNKMLGYDPAQKEKRESLYFPITHHKIVRPLSEIHGLTDINI